MKLIGMDYDGTLCWPNHQVPQGNVDLINEYRLGGDCFAIVTGRSIISIKIQCEKYDINCDYFVGANGSIITDGNYKIIETNHIDKAEVRRIYKYAQSIDCEAIVLSNGVIISTNNDKYADEGNHYPKYTNDQFIDEMDIAMVCIEFDNHEAALKCEKEIAKNFKNISVYANVYSVDISAKGISKATGIKKLLELSKADEVFVIGDGHNDVPMVEEYNGYTLEHGADELKNIAKKVLKNLKEFMKIVKE